MKIRRAASADVGVLAALRLEMLQESGALTENLGETIEKNTRRYVESGLRDNSYAAWVAVGEGMVVGMCGVNFYSLPPNDWCPEGKTAYIGNLYTRPAFRRMGIAGVLLQAAIEEAKSRGCQRILLDSSDMGRSLYEKYGFAASGTAMSLFPFGLGVTGG